MQPQSSRNGGTAEAEQNTLLKEIIEATNAAPMTASEAKERALVDIQIATAKKFPRNPMKCKSNALALATMDQDTAEHCSYTLPRDGKSITGKSIRLAEIIACTWGHLRISSSVVEIGETMATVQGTAHDLETNVAYSVEVQRKIAGKRGRFSDDMIVTTLNAATSIALRNAIFRVIPGAYTDAVWRAARAIAEKGMGDIGARREKLAREFAEFDVTKEQLARYGRAAAFEKITADGIVALIGVLNSLRDGDIEAEDVFTEASKEKADRGAGAVAKIEKALAEPAKQAPPATQPAAKPAPTDQTYDEVLAGVPWMNDTQRVGVKNLARKASIAAVDLAGMVQDASDADKPSEKLAEFMTAAAAGVPWMNAAAAKT